MFPILLLAAEPFDRCVEVGKTAFVVMEERQKERPVSELMRIYEKDPKELREFMQRLILDAYEEPGYSTPKYKQQAAKEFRNKWELACYKSRKD